MEPAPRQPGGPPIWLGGRSEAALRRAGRLADGWMSYVVTPSMYRSALDTIAEAYEILSGLVVSEMCIRDWHGTLRSSG